MRLSKQALHRPVESGAGNKLEQKLTRRQPQTSLWGLVTPIFAQNTLIISIFMWYKWSFLYSNNSIHLASHATLSPLSHHNFVWSERLLYASQNLPLNSQAQPSSTHTKIYYWFMAPRALKRGENLTTPSQKPFLPPHFKKKKNGDLVQKKKISTTLRETHITWSKNRKQLSWPSSEEFGLSTSIGEWALFMYHFRACQTKKGLIIGICSFFKSFEMSESASHGDKASHNWFSPDLQTSLLIPSQCEEKWGFLPLFVCAPNPQK